MNSRELEEFKKRVRAMVAKVLGACEDVEPEPTIVDDTDTNAAQYTAYLDAYIRQAGGEEKAIHVISPGVSRDGVGLRIAEALGVYDATCERGGRMSPPESRCRLLDAVRERL